MHQKCSLGKENLVPGETLLTRLGSSLRVTTTSGRVESHKPRQDYTFDSQREGLLMPSPRFWNIINLILTIYGTARVSPHAHKAPVTAHLSAVPRALVWRRSFTYMPRTNNASPFADLLMQARPSSIHRTRIEKQSEPILRLG